MYCTQYNARNIGTGHPYLSRNNMLNAFLKWGNSRVQRGLASRTPGRPAFLAGSRFCKLHGVDFRCRFEVQISNAGSRCNFELQLPGTCSRYMFVPGPAPPAPAAAQVYPMTSFFQECVFCPVTYLMTFEF